MIRYDPTLVDLTSNFFVLCTNMNVFIYIIIHSGLSLAWIFMKERVYLSEILYNTYPAPSLDLHNL